MPFDWDIEPRVHYDTISVKDLNSRSLELSKSITSYMLVLTSGQPIPLA
jgi:hypothetical protein